MSSENQNQNGVAPQSNGLKNPLSSISTPSAMPAISTTGRTSSNNSSFLYSSNSLLSRDKMRQAPPPTLPKYTSSFNSGSNGTTDRLTRDRDVGGSYRLASLDRLALRQRVLQDGEKPNGDTSSVRE